MNAIDDFCKEHGKTAYLMENPDRVIFESGNVYEFLAGHLSLRCEMRHVETREPFLFSEISDEEKRNVYGSLGIASVLSTSSNGVLIWEY